MDTDELSSQLPPYLLPEQKDQLFSEINKFFKDGIQPEYFIRNDRYPEILQGDTWGEIRYYDPVYGKERSVKGVIFSNSCDVSQENKRDQPIRIVFSPLLKLENYLKRVEEVRGAQGANDVGDAIRKQRVTPIFYLPPSSEIPFETIVPLDNFVSLPVDSLFKDDPRKLSCLSQMGFYLFIIKLSIHLTRFQEGIARFS